MSTAVSPSTKDAFTVLRNVRKDMLSYGVKDMWLFGSRARGDEKPGSDWDVLVEFDAPPSFITFMELKHFLEERLGGRVDLLSRAACKPRFLEAIKSDLRHVA